MKVDGQDINPESQSYGHNDDIHTNVSSNNNDHYFSEMDLKEDLFESDEAEENMSRKLMTNKAVMKILLNVLHHWKA